MKPSTDPRGNAAQTLSAVMDDAMKLPQALEQCGYSFSESRDRALLKALCFGVLRWLPRLDFLFRILCARPGRTDTEIRCLVYIGIYQLDFMDMPPYAAVSSSVAACNSIGKGWARVFVNALLRRYLREREHLCDAWRGDEVARYAHPQWLLNRLKEAYPKQWQEIIEQNNLQAPLFLRINRLKIEDDAFLAQLADAGLPARACESLPHAVEIPTPLPVEQLPGFFAGHFAVQDLSAQWAATALMESLEERDTKELRVLDACAAPGGKTGAIWEHCAGNLGELCAVEMHPTRFVRLGESLERLGHVGQRLRLLNADASDPSSWWDGCPWDRILLDVPCSGSGIIRRQPDIKTRRSPKQMKGLRSLQQALLESCWHMLKPGGRLLYATCSVFPEENGQQIEAFARAHASDCVSISIQCALPAVERGVGIQILPGVLGMDGFFYALLEKTLNG